MLENLTSGSVKAAMKEAGAASADLWMCPIGDIRIIDGFNVRSENAEYADHIEYLTESILANGFYRDKPLSGYVAREDGKNVIKVVDGHSRLKAAFKAIERGAEISVLPVVTKPAGTNPEDLLVGLVVSNSGKPLSPIEKAAVCKRLIGFGMDEKTIAKRLGMTTGYVFDLLTLIGSPRELRKLVESGSISAANATRTVKKHGEKATAVIVQSLDTAKAAGKTKVTKAALSPKKDLFAEGVAFINLDCQYRNPLDAMCDLLAHLTGRSAEEVQKATRKAA